MFQSITNRNVAIRYHYLLTSIPEKKQHETEKHTPCNTSKHNPLGTSVPIASAAPETQPDPAVKCALVQVVGVPGSGSTHSSADPEDKQEIQPGWNPAKELEEKYGAGNVHGITVPYPASLGYLYSAQALQGTPEGYIGGYEGVGYSQSVQTGVDWAKNYMTETAQQCGEGTKWVVYGFSQGADVAGDLAAEISNGGVSGVSPDDVVAVTLISDPNKSPLATEPLEGDNKVHLYAPVPKGIVQSNGEVSNTSIDGKQGVAGSREENFNALYGKVLSLCDADDFPCANRPGSLLSDVTKIAQSDTGFSLTDEQMQSINTIISTVKGGSIDIAVLLSPALPLVQDPSLPAGFRKITDAARPVIAEGDKEGWIALIDEYRPTLEKVLKTPFINAIAKPVVDIINDILSLRPEGEVTEAGKASLVEFQNSVKNFQNGSHLSYFGQDNGSPANLAREWMSEGVKNALENSSRTATVSEVTADILGLESEETSPHVPSSNVSELPEVSTAVSPSPAPLTTPTPQPSTQALVPSATDTAAQGNPENSKPARKTDSTQSNITLPSSEPLAPETSHSGTSTSASPTETRRVLATTGVDLSVILTIAFAAILVAVAGSISDFRRKKNTKTVSRNR